MIDLDRYALAFWQWVAPLAWRVHTFANKRAYEVARDIENTQRGKVPRYVNTRMFGNPPDERGFLWFL